MNLKEVLMKMTNIQTAILDYIDDENNFDDDLEKLQIPKEKYFIISLLHLLCQNAKYHHHGVSLYYKIEEILQFFKIEIKRYFSNSEIFSIFKKNKRILLFLIEEKILEMDEFIINKITSDKYVKMKYPEYFSPEIKPFIQKEFFIKEHGNDNLIKIINKQLPLNFYTDRKSGENHFFLCSLIRNDSVEEFIQYITINKISINSTINQSIYETNSFLLKNENFSLIEYAAFCGSIQIFQYLVLNNVELLPSLWLFAIHGKNPEIIHLLEQNEVDPEDITYNQCYEESIKCHHNDIANYFKDNNDLIKENENFFIKILKWQNFAFINLELINQSSFYYLCKYDYPLIVDFLYMKEDYDINVKII